MFENQIPEFPEFARQGVPAGKAEQTNAISEMYPQEGNPPQGWGLSFMLTQDAGATGRGKNTGSCRASTLHSAAADIAFYLAWWAGIANLYWWCDRERGVAGMVGLSFLHSP